MLSQAITLPARIKYYVIVLISAVFYCGLVYSSLDSIAQAKNYIHSSLQWAFIAFVVLSLLIHYSVSMVGVLLFGAPKAQNDRNIASLRLEGWDPEKKLIFCFASRGTNQEVLKQSITQAISVARSCGVPFSVELVVDEELKDSFFEKSGCHIIVVPSKFETPCGSRFKARALHYACAARRARQQDLNYTWILHCDEETLVTEQCLAGIHKFLKLPRSNSMCGAGEIKYNSPTYGVKNIFGLIDSHRTGEDLGRFRFQYKVFKAALFGAHGSFLLIPAPIEEAVQFDFGPQGSITEDVYFAFKARQLRIPIVWLEGYVREQSPQSLKDFFKQRARWIHGLLNVCFDPAFSAKHRIILLAYLAMWRTTIFAGIILLFFVTSVQGYPFITTLWLIDLTVIGTILLVGGLRNLEEDLVKPNVEEVAILLVLFALSPFICLMETLAVVYGVCSKRDEFYVVQKVVGAQVTSVGL